MTRIRLFTVSCVLIATPGIAANPVFAQNNEWYYSYFKERIPLTLDTTRIAVWMPAPADGAAVVVPRLARLGLPDDAVHQTVLRRWFFADTPPAERSADAVQRIVKRISADASIGFVSPVFRDRYGPTAMTSTLFVGFHAGVTDATARRILTEVHAGAIRDRNWSHMSGVYRVKSGSRNGFEVLAVANQLAQRPEVKFAEPDRLITARTDLMPNDPGFNSDPGAWGVHNTGQIGSSCPSTAAGTPDMDMDGPEAWDITIGDPNVIVVIMDVGIQQDHLDLNQIPGMDFTGSGTGGGPLNECDGHGTNVGGCVSAIINNAVGTVGIAPGCRVASAKWGVSSVPCDLSFFALTSWLINALDWTVSIGARMTNSSFGSGESAVVTTKYTDTRAAGVIHFAAAGNSAVGQIGYPAKIGSVNAIAALQRNGNLASFSQYGNGLAFSAPGCAIYTTAMDSFLGTFATVNGTSFATPYSCGVAAMVLSVDPTLRPDDVDAIMQQTSIDLGDPGYDTMFGWGFVNAHQAVLAASRPVFACAPGKITADVPTAGDEVGGDVAVSADVMAVGAPFSSDGATSESGAAFAFRFDGTTWNQEARLAPGVPAAGDQFGNAVGASGDVIVVGAQRDDSAGSNAGAAYVFRWDGSAWAFEQKLTASDGADTDFFGSAVGVDGGVLVVGAFVDDCPDGSSNCGSAYVYRFDGSAWQEEQKLTASDAAPTDLFGTAVSIRDGLIAIGAPNAACTGGTFCGAVYLFAFDGTSWQEIDKLQASDASDLDFFGTSVDHRGDVLAVGARGASCANGSDDCGAAYVFRFDGLAWQEEARVTSLYPSTVDAYGSSVSIEGDVLIVGAEEDGCATVSPACGAVYVYHFDGTTWFEQAKLFSPDASGDDRFGRGLALENAVATIGAPRNDCVAGDDCGATYVFGVSGDCNENGVFDRCDISTGFSTDLNGDLIPDECTCLESRPARADPIGIKNRFLSITGGTAGHQQAIRVTFVDLPAPFDVWNGAELWAGPPSQVSESGSLVDPPPGGETFTAASLTCEPSFTDWSGLGTIHLFHEGIVPTGSYEVSLIDETCPTTLLSGYSAPLAVTTADWGDTLKDLTMSPAEPPDGDVTVLDVVGILGRFVSDPASITKARADLEPGCLDLVINISDALLALGAFQGLSYPFDPSAIDPCDSPCVSPLP